MKQPLQRRQFIAAVGAAATVLPFVARAQLAMPVIGYLGAETPERFASRLEAFRKGLGEAGYVEGRNVGIEYRWAEGRYERLPAMAADLVNRKVSVVTALGGNVPAQVAKDTVKTIPVVFETGADPVALGLVASMKQPGGNLTGVSSLNREVGPKRLELLHELVPAMTSAALLMNPGSSAVEDQSRQMEEAAHSLGLDLHVLDASTETAIDAAFEKMATLRIGGLVITSNTFFATRNRRLADLAARHAIPAIHQSRDFLLAGGLMSYGGSFLESHYQAGLYTGRILKGEKPADLPVQQVTKVELAINLKAAKALGLTVPLTLLARADEVIE